MKGELRIYLDASFDVDPRQCRWTYHPDTLSPAIIGQGLESLPEKHDYCHVLLSDDIISTHPFMAPNVPEKKLDKIVGPLIEDYLLEDLDDLKILTPNYQAGSINYAWVINKKWLSQAIDCLNQYGCFPNSVIPMFYLSPWTTDKWSLIYGVSSVSLRTTINNILPARTNHLRTLIIRQISESRPPEGIIIFSDSMPSDVLVKDASSLFESIEHHQWSWKDAPWPTGFSGFSDSSLLSVIKSIDWKDKFLKSTHAFITFSMIFLLGFLVYWARLEYSETYYLNKINDMVGDVEVGTIDDGTFVSSMKFISEIFPAGVNIKSLRWDGESLYFSVFNEKKSSIDSLINQYQNKFSKIKSGLSVSEYAYKP